VQSRKTGSRRGGNGIKKNRVGEHSTNKNEEREIRERSEAPIGAEEETQVEKLRLRTKTNKTTHQLTGECKGRKKTVQFGKGNKKGRSGRLGRNKFGKLIASG